MASSVRSRRNRMSTRTSRTEHLASSLFVRWQNFRGFEDTGWIELAPITTVIGPNNSGKTSLHAPLLLLKQSLDVSRSESPLSLRGDLVNLGRFEDFIRDHDSSRTLSLGLCWSRPEEPGELGPLGSEPPATVTLEFSLAKGTLILSRFVVHDVAERPMLDRRRVENGTYTIEGLEWAQANTDAPTNSRARDELYRSAIANDRPQNFLFSGDSIFADVIGSPDEGIDDGHGEDEDGQRLATSISPLAIAYLQVVGYVQERVSRVLRQVNYLGPLRDAPRRAYELPSEPVRAVGSRGEHTAEVFCSGTAASREKVNEWLGTLDPHLRVHCDEVVSGVVRLMVSGRDTVAANIADVGFGVGQVLPIAVAGLSEQGENAANPTLAMEQPEIHLNPRIQGRLADLVVQMAHSGKRAYVETHSEHFLLRLRTDAARARDRLENPPLTSLPDE